jgi:hypothetical protein
MLVKVYFDSQATEPQILATVSAIRELRFVTSVEVLDNPLSISVGPVPRLDPENHFERSMDAQNEPDD